MYEVRTNAVTVTRDGGGASTRYDTNPATLYSGDLLGAIAALEALPIGVSVEVRFPKGSHTILRSCMNKPSLWLGLRGLLVNPDDDKAALLRNGIERLARELASEGNASAAELLCAASRAINTLCTRDAARLADIITASPTKAAALESLA